MANTYSLVVGRPGKGIFEPKLYTNKRKAEADAAALRTQGYTAKVWTHGEEN